MLQASTWMLFHLLDSQLATAPRAAATEGVDLQLLLTEGLAPMLRSPSFQAAAALRQPPPPVSTSVCSSPRALRPLLPLGPTAPPPYRADADPRAAAATLGHWLDWTIYMFFLEPNIVDKFQRNLLFPQKNNQRIAICIILLRI